MGQCTIEVIDYLGDAVPVVKATWRLTSMEQPNDRQHVTLEQIIF